MKLRRGLPFVMAVQENSQETCFCLIDPSISATIRTTPPLKISMSAQQAYITFSNFREYMVDIDSGKKVKFDIEKSEYRGYKMYTLTMQEPKVKKPKP